MKILLVEDSRAIVAVMSVRLSSFGHEVTVAENGEIALALFIEQAPDLILMDIEMPVMNGFEATARIRAIETTQDWAWTPILFLTASDTRENLVTAIEAGGDDFIVKSVSEDVLQAKMKAMARIAALRSRLTVANRLLLEQASRDGLTGLYNRRYMDMKLDLAWSEAKRDSTSFGLLMLDIDHFKKYNDHYGHLAGDDCLRKVAGTIGSVVDRYRAEREAASPFAARYGGEEFAVVMPLATRELYHGLAGALLDAVRGIAVSHQHNADWGIVTLSIGGAFVMQADDTLATLFRAADERLYIAKERGRNGCVLS
ncbi:MAG: diguanylate cyclase [Methyloversatilis sp.]|uniref:GGDEF domain-containing response regulator n=1 Tax=Methyloversatilis sp. TaxID=2569862 RepID=UPI002733953F|nr:diguanylate cyclase [Methyloversatilis sp.]MDP3873180.1 diguanylate cyclase [Methyloversatilis sp.]